MDLDRSITFDSEQGDAGSPASAHKKEPVPKCLIFVNLFFHSEKIFPRTCMATGAWHCKCIDWHKIWPWRWPSLLITWFAFQTKEATFVEETPEKEKTTKLGFYKVS